jgi:hypothetical protein
MPKAEHERESGNEFGPALAANRTENTCFAGAAKRQARAASRKMVRGTGKN